MDSIDEHLIPQAPLKDDPPADLAWWERRRPRYNMFLIGMIVLMLWQLDPRAITFGWEATIFWSVAYGAAANVFYSLVYLLPQRLRYYLKKDFGLSSTAPIIFNLGEIISLLTTSLVYSIWLLPFSYYSTPNALPLSFPSGMVTPVPDFCRN